MILGTLRCFSSGSEEEEEGLEAGECGVRGAAEDEGLVGSAEEEDDEDEEEFPREKRGILRKPFAPMLMRRKRVLLGASSVLVGDPSSAGLSLDFFMCPSLVVLPIDFPFF